jgi:hypothetical protein
MKKYILAIGVFLSMAFLPSTAGDCKEAKKQLAEAQAKLEEFNREGLAEVDDFRKVKVELWKLRSEVREYKYKNEGLKKQLDSLKVK